MSANSPTAVWERSTENVVFGVNDNLHGQVEAAPQTPTAQRNAVQGAEGEPQFYTFSDSGGAPIYIFSDSKPQVETPLPKEISKRPDDVIVERTPTLVRKVAILKSLPERRPIPPLPLGRNLVVKSTKLLPAASYRSGCHVGDLPKTIMGGKKPAKTLGLNVNKRNFVEQREDVPETQESGETYNDIFKLMGKEETGFNSDDEKYLPPQSEQGNKAKDYVKLQIEKRRQQRIQEQTEKREKEEEKQKKLKELKDKQLKLVQDNVRRARQRQQKQQYEQETTQVTAPEHTIPEDVQVTAPEHTIPEELYQQDSTEEMKPDIQHMLNTDTMLPESKENYDINTKFKGMVAAMQKELRAFGHQQNKEDKEEIMKEIQSITLRSKDTRVLSEQPSFPNVDGLVGKVDQLKRTGSQKQSELMHIPLNIGDREAFFHGSDLEPTALSHKRQDASFLPQNSLQAYNGEKQISFGVKKEVAKVLKEMNLKTSVTTNSNVESTANLHPKSPIMIKKHSEPKGKDVQKLKSPTLKAKDVITTTWQSIPLKWRDDGSLDATKCSTFSPDDPLSEWLKPMYVEPCPNNMMAAIQNTILSKSGPKQPYWMQANCEYVNKQPVTGQTNEKVEPVQALPVLDASKERFRKHPTVHQFIHASKMNGKEYGSFPVSDDESMQSDIDSLSVNSSVLETEHNSSSDESRSKWKKRLNLKSPQEVLPSRVQPVKWSKSESDVFAKTAWLRAHQNSRRISIEESIRSLGSAGSVPEGKPTVIPRKVKCRHSGLVAPNVELRHENEKISAIPPDFSCQAENSGTDTWDSHAVQHQHVGDVEQAPSSVFQPVSGVIQNAYRKGQAHHHSVTSQETGDSKHTEKNLAKQDGGILHREQSYVNSGNKHKVNIKSFHNEVRSDEKDAEEVNAQFGEPPRPITISGKNIADIIEAGRMLNPSALHFQFQAEMNRLDSVEESRQRLAEIEAIFAENMLDKLERESKKQTQRISRTFGEHEQVQAEPTIQTCKSNVQTFGTDNLLLVTPPKNQAKQPVNHTERKTESPFFEAALGQDKQVQVDSSANAQTLEVLPQVRPTLSSQNETVPEMSNTQMQSQVLIEKCLLFEDQNRPKDIQDPANPISIPTLGNIAGTSDAVLETLHPPVAVEQLLRETQHTRRMIVLDYKEYREAVAQRRENLIKELSEKYEKRGIRHKEFIKRTDKEDNDQLHKKLLGKFTAPLPTRPFVNVPAPQFSQPARRDMNTNFLLDTHDIVRTELANDSRQLKSSIQIAAEPRVDEQDNIISESLQQIEQKFSNVNYKRGSEIPGEALTNIGKEVKDLEKTVNDNTRVSTPDQSFQTISEGISEEDVSDVRPRKKEMQDLNFSEASSNCSDLSINETDRIKKLSRIRESLHKIDNLIHEEKETAQKHVYLLNEKFKLLKERNRADMKLLLVLIREHREKGEEICVLGLKKKQLALLHNLEQAREQNKREYDRLQKATVKRKSALRQQKAVIKSYLKSVQLRGRILQESHRSGSALNDDSHKRPSATATEDISVPSIEEDVLEPDPKLESSEISGVIAPDLAAAEDQKSSSNEANVTAADTSLNQQLYSENSEEKVHSFEEIIESAAQTEAGTEVSDLEIRVRGLCEQLHKKKIEAERLWKEQQRKKRERLRVKEQSLLKQIQAYDEYIDKTKKELEDKKDYSIDSYLPYEKLWIDDEVQIRSEHDTGPAGDSSTSSSSKKKSFKQKHDKDEENNSKTGDFGLVSATNLIPMSTGDYISEDSTLKGQHDISDMKNNEFQVLSDYTNASIKLRETSHTQTIESPVSQNLSVESTLQSFVSSSSKKDDLEDGKGLEEISEELEEELEEERESQLNSVVHNHNSGSTVQELLYEESESIIQELLVSKQSSIQEVEESVEEVESIPEEESDPVTRIEDNKDKSESLEQELQNVVQLSDPFIFHTEERAVVSNVSSMKDAVQHDVVLKSEETDIVREEIVDVEVEEEEDISEAEEEIEKIPKESESEEGIPQVESEKEISKSKEDIPKAEEFYSLNVVSEDSEVLFVKDSQESERNCDINQMKEKADEEISEKVERITDLIFQKVLKESCRILNKSNTKTLELFNRSDFVNQLIEDNVEENEKQADLRNQVLINGNESSNNRETLDKENEDKNLDRIYNLTNGILQQLLVESSEILYSKKSKIDASGNTCEDSESTCESEACTGDEAITGTPAPIPSPPDRSGINVRKRIHEILAESSCCLSTTKEKTRPQDFMITTYDVLSPEETPAHTPQPGSPSKEELDKTITDVSEDLEEQQKVELEVPKNGELDGPDNEGFSQEWFDEDYGLSHTRREAEELRLQQLQIEQEIQELEQAQQHLPYFYIREIPNKPPPPYTPPGQTAKSPSAPATGVSCIPLSKQDLTSEEESRFIPSTAEEITSLVEEVANYLYDFLAAGGDLEHVEAPSQFYEDATNMSDIKKSSRTIFKKMIFDLTKDMIKEITGLEREKPCAPWDWPAFSHKINKLSPRSMELLKEMVMKQALDLFGFAPKTYKEKLVIRCSRKKRDYVDEILMKESHEEESAWTNYDEDEVIVKNEIALGLLDSVLDETVQIILGIIKTKLSDF